MSLHIREVVLEILRHGPAHNQLLSPLTQYLALCGSHPAVSLTVPFEHRELQYLLSRMNYEEGLNETTAPDRAFARTRLSQAVTCLLEQIPALPHEGRVGADELLHLRLMTTPQELAMLPFELADPPSGFQSGGQPLLIGPTPDVVLTREVRRSSSVRVRVPPTPKVLLVAAAPSGQIPLEANRSAIEEAIRPWARPAIRDGVLALDLDPHLVVAEQASLDEIREHCASGSFTHVHILGHGDELREPGKEGFGLALWNRQKTNMEVVDGTALARALRPPQDDSAWAKPWCVVLCTCYSSNIGGVVHPTASLAHALHVAGIPFVVASQYPLTFGAANKLCQTLYPLELRGEDPRRTLRDVRHAIASHMRQTHDWASLIAYAAWPSDVEQQLDEVRLARVFAQLEAAQDWADRVIAHADVRGDSEAGASVIARSLRMVEAASKRLKYEARSKERERDEIRYRKGPDEMSPHERRHLQGNVTTLLTEIYGLLGSASKRRARLHDHQGMSVQAEEALCEAAGWYLKGTELQATEHWTSCQSFVLLGLGCREEGWAGENERSSAREQWRVAKIAATRALQEPSDRVWAYATLIEVELWRPVLGMSREATNEARKKCQDEATERAKGYLRELIEEAKFDKFPLQSTVRQLRRYIDWWGQAGYVSPEMIERVNQLLAVVGQDRLEAKDAEQANLEIDLPESLDRACDEPKTGKVLGSGKVVSVGEDKGQSPDKTFSVQMLPARQGDALWIEYGKAADPHRILIDGGFRTTIRTVEKRIRELAQASPTGKCHFELGVVSHIDADHIEGLIEMIGAPLPVSFGDFWFNGRKHLDVPAVEFSPTDDAMLGGKHGLFLDTVLEATKTPWNKNFRGGKIVVPPGKKTPRTVTLPGGMKLTIMSPTQAKLDELAEHWDDEVHDAGLDAATFEEILRAMDKLHYRTGALDAQLLRRKKPTGPVDIEALLEEPDGADDTAANGSSIAFLAAYEGRSCLFMADAHPDVMLASIDRMVGKTKRLPVGAVKLSHHGSGNNVTLELLKRIDSRMFLVSTNGGGGHYHPDRSAMAKLIAGKWRPRRKAYPITILFNYRSEYTKIWDDDTLKQKYDYTVEYADPGDILKLAAVPKTSG